MRIGQRLHTAQYLVGDFVRRRKFKWPGAQRRVAFRAWSDRGFSSPAIPEVKQAVLSRYSRRDVTWIETGTYLGDTTEFLSNLGQFVYTIEPETTFFTRARERFAQTPNVKVVHGRSEEVLAPLIDEIDGAICFWFDGHFSGEGTYQGPSDSPIEHELSQVSTLIHEGRDVTVFVDDVRLFGTIKQYATDENYPSRSWLVNWANNHQLDWYIEHDIFIAWRA